MVPSVGEHFDRRGVPYLEPGVLIALAFEELARVAAAISRWTFLFVVAPLVVMNGSGSPVNPLAIF